MRSTRRRNWLIKRIALGLAVAAVAVPVAQAKVDEGQSQGQSYTAFVSDFPKTDQVKDGQYGMPRALPNDYALSNGDLIETVRAQPKSVGSDHIEFVRTQPRSVGQPEIIAAPGFDWGDAGIGAGLALAFVLLLGGATLATRHAGHGQTA